MIDERTRKILLAIIKHCNIIQDTKKYFGDNYHEFEQNNIYQNAILTPVTQIGELVKRLEYIDKAIKYVNGYDFKQFCDDEKTVDATIFAISQIGELVKRLPNEFRIEYTEIPWKNIAGMRDIVVHNYETIDKLILWNVADKEIDKVRQFCIKILK